ncbi:short-chain dehydrogenase [Maritimibacter sp. 55A14]|uniref:SDR family oxidoreductase n=1 Tax=Maritimibacter sp. 55A14 TaxID=2174844 RepID=UPI000D6064C8|nr:SDR family oxidoreductase [Maritimibacter sp. 55A14]PWE31141.1 short-chain dehydrogenase [Maritimibacter sp. 55A14]
MARTTAITGAGSGIGAATARAFLDAGWRVALMGRRPAPLEEVAAGNPDALVVPADVSDADQVDRAFATLVQGLGRLDVLFNNAGVFPAAATIDETDPAEWRRVVDINLTGAFLCARAAFAQMRAQRPQGGRIINNGSIAAHVPRPRSVAYTATKHAITGLTRALSLDGRDFDIACGQIDIGNARTPMVEALSRRDPQPTMDVADAARAVLHMAELPLEANVQFMTLMATKMPYIGRG